MNYYTERSPQTLLVGLSVMILFFFLMAIVYAVKIKSKLSENSEN
jgi:hypothetical protein